jgi:sugar phosphate isomerase/epimerase
MKIGIHLPSLNLPIRQGLQEAARLGVGGVQLDAVGDLAPNQLSETGRRELRHLLRSYNLELTALGCPLRFGLDHPENQDARIEHVRKVMTLSFDLGPRVVVVEAGKVPDDLNSPRAARMTESLLALGRHGDRSGTVLALETGLESGEALAAFLARFDTGGLGVNYDPANMVLNGFDPVENLAPLRGRVVHTYARDARAAGASRAAAEVPLGAGDVDWMAYLGALEALEYRGWVTVKRDGGTNRLADVANGVTFLRRLVG